MSYSPGFVGDAFDFTAPSALWVGVGGPEGESFTIEAWVFLASDASGWQVIYVGTHGFYLLDGKAAWWHGGILFAGTSVLSTGVWHHVAITYDDATDTFAGYFDGQPDGTSTSADNYLPYGASIGYTNGASHLNGKIDELCTDARSSRLRSRASSMRGARGRTWCSEISKSEHLALVARRSLTS